VAGGAALLGADETLKRAQFM